MTGARRRVALNSPTYTFLQRAMHIHPTVELELIATMLGELKPL
jgi:hypothetical protein